MKNIVENFDKSLIFNLSNLTNQTIKADANLGFDAFGLDLNNKKSGKHWFEDAEVMALVQAYEQELEAGDL